jgi:hypothetical protein
VRVIAQSLARLPPQIAAGGLDGAHLMQQSADLVARLKERLAPRT